MIAFLFLIVNKSNKDLREELKVRLHELSLVALFQVEDVDGGIVIEVKGVVKEGVGGVIFDKDPVDQHDLLPGLKSGVSRDQANATL